MNWIIETTALTKTFGSLTALDNVTLKVEEGTAFGFLGPNGAGKTTMVRLLNGLLKPTGGTAKVLDRDIKKDSDFIRSRCGVLTDTSLYERLSARDNLMIWGGLYSIKPAKLKSRVDSLLSMVGLYGRGYDLVGSFSKGMKQKLAIIRALLNEPEVLFLDEPTAGLDPEAAEEIIAYLKKYIKDGNRTVFLCSHRLEEVEELCDRIAIIFKGKILASGQVTELAKQLWKENQFIIRLVDVKGIFIEALKNEKGLTGIVAEENIIKLSMVDAGSISNIIKALVMAGAEILSVQQEHHTLKDIYFKLVPKE
jgi:ABC-2 type transport system ATP-binding protein